MGTKLKEWNITAPQTSVCPVCKKKSLKKRYVVYTSGSRKYVQSCVNRNCRYQVN